MVNKQILLYDCTLFMVFLGNIMNTEVCDFQEFV